MSFPRTWLIASILAAICLHAGVGAQFPFGGPRGDRGAGPMAEWMERLASGRVEDVNAIKGYIQVAASRRGSRIVVVSDETEFTQLAQVPLSEVRVGDEVSVTGVPTAIRAETVLLSQPLTMADILQEFQDEGDSAEPETEPSVPDQPDDEQADSEGAGEGATEASPPSDQEETEPEPRGGPPARGPDVEIPTPPLSTTLSGVVKSLEPFVVELRDGQQISVAMPADAHVFRRQEADISAAQIGAQVLAIGQVNGDGYLAAHRVFLGESVSMGMGRSGRGPGSGGPPPGFGSGPEGPMPGGPARGFGGPPTRPFEEE